MAQANAFGWIVDKVRHSAPDAPELGVYRAIAQACDNVQAKLMTSPGEWYADQIAIEAVRLLREGGGG